VAVQLQIAGSHSVARRRRLARRAHRAAEAALWLAGSACLALLVLVGTAGLFR